MKSRGGKSQRREETTKEHQGRKRVRRQKMQGREKVAKWFVAPEGRKVGSLKRWVRSHVVRWKIKVARRCGTKQISKSNCTKHTSVGPLLEVEMSKKCTPLWCEAHLEFKSVKNWWVRSTFGSWDVEKMRAVVARSTFRSQNVQSTPGPGHFWKLRCRKSARRCSAKHIFWSHNVKNTQS